MLALRFLALTLLSISLYLPAFADPLTDAVPSSFQVMGRGIQNQSNNEIILIACVGTTSNTTVADCNTLRLVQLKPQTTPTWLGNPFPIENTIQAKEDLQKWYSEQWVNGVFKFLTADYTYSFTDKNGWNWSNNPLQLSSKKSKRVLSTLLYFAEYKHAVESEKKIVATKISKKHSHDLTEDNFNKCYNLKSKDNSSNLAVDECMKDSQNYTFIDNPGFDKCFDLKFKTLRSDPAVNQCMEDTKKFEFAKNKNFDKCYNLRKQDESSDIAVNKCMEDSNKYSFINNPSFDKCFELKFKSLRSDPAVNQCMSL